MQDFVRKNYNIVFLVFILGIIGLSFGLGFEKGKGSDISSSISFSCPNTILEKQKIIPQALGSETSSKQITEQNLTEKNVAGDSEAKGVFMGSKNGTKYYTPGCPGSKRIKPTNYIWFKDTEDATLQGYSKGSC